MATVVKHKATVCETASEKKWTATSALTLIIKPIDTVDAGTLVVATQHEEVLGILDLVRQQQTDGLQ